MQNDNIINKARRLGLDTTDINTIAAQLGVDAGDLNALESVLDERLQEQSINQRNIADSHNKYNPDNSEHERFGEREYNQARNENGGYDKNYYANKGKELDKKVEEAENEKNRNFKKKDPNDNSPIKADGSNTQNKSNWDKAKDNINLAKAKNDRFQNKLNNAKANAYRAMHPGEALKDEIKSKANEKVKEVGNKAKEAGKKAVKDTTKTAMKAIVNFIKNNPYILGILGIFSGIFLLLIMIVGIAANETNNNDKVNNCDIISMNVTSLSRNEFITGVENYFLNNPKSYGNVFIEKAGTIYDLATSNNINPELVVLRAVAEGGAPGGDTNNYWGISVYNTSSSGSSFASFDEGVLKFIEIISEYKTVTDMMKKYAYIGDYWYNPGSAGLGGCYYFSSIKEFMSSASRIAAVETACMAGPRCTADDPTGCIPTNDQDQEAYAKYTVSLMADIRKDMFGLEADVCGIYSTGCTIYNQWDSRWGSVTLGNSNATMAKYGCAVTALAIGISCANTELTVDLFDAGVFLDYLNRGNCFTSTGAIRDWNCPAINEVAPNVKHITRVDLTGKSIAEKIALVEAYATGNQFVILHNNKQGHFVVYERTAANYFFTKDPNGGDYKYHYIPEIDRFEVFSY